MLIELADGGIEEITTDTHHFDGCETCDYGSEYINEFEVTLMGGTISVKVNRMYDYALTEDYLMKLFLKNVDKIKEMTEKKFSDWLKEKLEEEAGEYLTFESKLLGVN